MSAAKKTSKKKQSKPNIGMLNEAPLHASLKALYALPGDAQEVPIEGFVVDILRSDSIIEIQTGSFGNMKRKLSRLLKDYRIRVVYPVAHERWIVKLPVKKSDSETRRKSPRRQGLEAVFRELVSIAGLVAHPNFELEVLLIREEQVRRFDGNKSWRRKGWKVDERRLLEIVDRRVIRNPDDLLDMCGGIPEPEFTSAELAAANGWERRVATMAAYCLRHCGAIEQIGKRGNAYLYSAAS